MNYRIDLPTLNALFGLNLQKFEDSTSENVPFKLKDAVVRNGSQTEVIGTAAIEAIPTIHMNEPWDTKKGEVMLRITPQKSQ